MTREEAYAWAKKTGALVNFAAKGPKGEPAVLVQIENDSGVGLELEDAVEDLKKKTHHRLREHAKRIEG